MTEEKKLTAKEVTALLIERYTARKTSNARELYDDNIVVPVPLTVPEPVVHYGKAAVKAAAEAELAANGGRNARMFDDLTITDLVTHETTNPDIAIGEFNYVTKIGEHVITLPNVVIIETRDGKAVRTRGYHNHAMMAVANGTAREFIASVEAAILPQDR